MINNYLGLLGQKTPRLNEHRNANTCAKYALLDGYRRKEENCLFSIICSVILSGAQKSGYLEIFLYLGSHKKVESSVKFSHF